MAFNKNLSQSCRWRLLTTPDNVAKWKTVFLGYAFGVSFVYVYSRIAMKYNTNFIHPGRFGSLFLMHSILEKYKFCNHFSKNIAQIKSTSSALLKPADRNMMFLLHNMEPFNLPSKAKK